MSKSNVLFQSPLHLAVRDDHHQIVQELLHRGADPSQPDADGNTSFHLAVIKRSSAALPLLLTASGNRLRGLDFLNDHGEDL